MKLTNLPQVLTLKEMWEKFDINVVKDLFHDQVSYSCPSSLTWIGGKENVINYFKIVIGGSQTISFLFGIDKKYKVVKKSKNHYSLLIHQIEGDIESKCLLNVRTLDDKIFCIEMEQVN